MTTVTDDPRVTSAAVPHDRATPPAAPVDRAAAASVDRATTPAAPVDRAAATPVDRATTAAAPDDALTVTPASVLHLHPLTLTPQAGSVVVGRPDTGRFVAVPPVGARAVELLRDGRTVADVERALTPPEADEPVDVLGFARSLVRLGFVAAVDDGTTATASRATFGHAHAPVNGPRPHLRWLFTRPAALAATAAALAAVVLLVAEPDVRPHPLDAFFLRTPAESLAALTVVAYVFAGLHELMHVYAAAALGVPARLRITRRLYFLTFETNLTGLWALPPRRRLGPLLAGMGFDAVVLCAALALRALHVGPDAFLAGLALVQLSAIVVQLFVFLRTDVYAVMTALLGCTTLAQTTRLLLRRTVRRLTPEQAATLAAAPARDVAVARWYRWVHVAGMALAAWFFVAFFVPSTWHLLQWMGHAVTASGPTTWAFYEAVVLGVLLLSPRALTAGVALRDMCSAVAPDAPRRRSDLRRRGRRHISRGPHVSPTMESGRRT